MDVMTEHSVVPKLRFGEFKDDWNNHLLDDIATFLKGKGISKSELDDDGKTECIRYGELYVYYNELIDEVKSKTNLENLVLSNANDVIIPASGETQLDIATASCVLRSGIALGGDLNVIRTENNGLFLSYYLNSKKKFEIARLSQGSSVVHLYASQLKTLNLNLPSISEQQKIASFLSAVDEKLQQLTKKKELLEAYKKGVMQKIFSQELRFKDDNGNNYPNWDEKKLGEVCDVTVGGTPSTTKKEYWDGDIGWISSGGLNNGNVTQPSKLITKLGLDNSSAKMMSENTVMLAMTGATLGRIGYLKFNSSANQSVAGFLPNETYNSKYLFYTLQHGVNQVFKYSGGAAQQGINKQSILNLKYAFPSIDEQHKIANFLSSLDSKIDLVSTQIENTKAFKKGLLQQMFV